MAVYLGTSGMVQLSRVGEGVFTSEMDPGDVNTFERRFSFDFPNGTFVSGDRLTITRVNADGTLSNQPLDFVSTGGWGDGSLHPDGTWFVHVDTIGGLRLYSSWEQSLEGARTQAIQLTTPGSNYRIAVSLAEAKPHCLGQVLDFTLSTQRDAVDVTALGEAFAERVSGLISGSGQITALWDWRPSTCGVGSVEVAQYFHQLVLRQQLGSEFEAELFIKQDSEEPLNDQLPELARRTAIYYKLRALVTNVSMAFSPTEPLRSVIQFAATGPIELLYGIPSAFLILQEDGAKLKLEDESGFLAQEDVT